MASSGLEVGDGGCPHAWPCGSAPAPALYGHFLPAEELQVELQELLV